MNMKRIQRAARMESLQRVVAAAQAAPLGHTEKQRVLSRIMAEVLGGRITPSESRTLIKAVEGGTHATKTSR